MLSTPGLARNQKVLLAVEAFPDQPEIQIRAAQAARAFLETIAGSIEPIFVARPALPGVFVQAPVGLDDAGLEEARTNIRVFLKEVSLPHVLPPRLIFSEAASIGSMVKALLEYAEENDFDLIAVSTHARTGMPRLFMGSFAEELLQRARLPVLVTSGKANYERAKAVKHLFFPTEFSEKSREVFEQVVALARELKADLLLFHQVELSYPEVALPFVPQIPQPPMKEIIVARKEEGEDWASWAARQGVKTKFHLSQRPGDPALAIARAAGKLPSCVIAMASQSSRLEALLLGSVTRKVVRAATCPVFVIHPQREVIQRERPEAPPEWVGHGRVVLG